MSFASSSEKPPVELIVRKDTAADDHDDDDDNDNDEEEDKNLRKSEQKKSTYGRLEDPGVYPGVDDDDMDRFCDTVNKRASVEELRKEYPWVYANAICYWLRNNNDRLTDEVYAPAIKAGEWDKVRYLVDLMLPRAPVLGLLVDSDCPNDVFAVCFDAACRGELQCPYCSTSDVPVTRNECDHNDLWKGIEGDELYEDRTSADDMMDRSSTECLTMHLNALLKRDIVANDATKLRCQVILRNSRAEEYDALLTRLFP